MPRDWKKQRERDIARILESGQDPKEVFSERIRISTKKRILKQWTVEVEARAIELFNEGVPRGDVTRILIKEGLYRPIINNTTKKLDNRGISLIFEDLSEGKVVHPVNKEKITFKEIKKGSPARHLLQSETVAQDKKILQHYLESPETFKGKPPNVLSKSFNARYGLGTGTLQKPGPGIAASTVKRALNAAISGDYPEFNEYFKGSQLTDFVIGRHENIFPQVKKLDGLIKEGLKDGYIMDESISIGDRMKKLKGKYAAAVGKSINDPKIENEFLTRMRKIVNRYVGTEERYNKKLYDTIKDPLSEIKSNVAYKNSPLKPTLIAITQAAGQMSNAHLAEAMGLPAKDVKLLKQLQQGTFQLARTYKLPLNPRSKKVSMAGDHTDMKALMRNYPKYEQNFMRIAYISEGLNLLKARYDQKILALYNKALAGHEYDTGPTKTQRHGGVKYAYEGRNTPYSGKLAPGQKHLTIPEAVKKIQKEFSELSGGYKIGGFDIKNRGAMGPDNITLQKPITRMINEGSSPFARTIRETLGNLRYGEPGGKRYAKNALNIVDQAIVSPEGATPEGRLNIIKRFGPKDLKGSGYIQSFRIQPYLLPGGGKIGKRASKTITTLLQKGYEETIAAANTNAGDICSLLGMKRGGLAGGGCGRQMRQALQEAPEQTMTKIAEVGSSKLKNVARSVLGMLGRGGVKAAPYAAIAAAGAAIEPLVKQFRNDDPTTYLSDENQQKGMLLSMIEAETPKVDEEILKWQMPALGAATAAGAIPGARELYLDRLTGRGPAGPAGTKLPATILNKPVGKTRAALGLSGVLGKALGASFSPLAVAATLPMDIAAQRKGGSDWADIATSPGNWMGPAFMGSGYNIASKGIVNPTLLKLLRFGISRGALAAMGPVGWAGLAGSLGLAGYDMWKNRGSKKKRFYDDD